MTHKVVRIPGDGIGPEVSDAVLRILTESYAEEGCVLTCTASIVCVCDP